MFSKDGSVLLGEWRVAVKERTFDLGGIAPVLGDGVGTVPSAAHECHPPLVRQSPDAGPLVNEIEQYFRGERLVWTAEEIAWTHGGSPFERAVYTTLLAVSRLRL
jgi:O6-methylguanine-DNA--protein-cysteine methyltransferase